MRERACRLPLLLLLASAVILGSESRGTYDHILLCQIKDSIQPGEPGSRIYIPREQGGPVIAPGIGLPFIASYDSQGCDRVIGTCLHPGYYILSALNGSDQGENTKCNTRKIFVFFSRYLRGLERDRTEDRTLSVGQRKRPSHRR
jgi:hypothetical protein